MKERIQEVYRQIYNHHRWYILRLPISASTLESAPFPRILKTEESINSRADPNLKKKLADPRSVDTKKSRSEQEVTAKRQAPKSKVRSCARRRRKTPFAGQRMEEMEMCRSTAYLDEPEVRRAGWIQVFFTPSIGSIVPGRPLVAKKKKWGTIFISNTK